jgi:cell division protein FtsB
VSVERYKLVQDNITAQANELKAIRERNSTLEIYIRQSEAKNGELSSTLATYSGNVAKVESEVQLLRSEKALQKVCFSSFWGWLRQRLIYIPR